MLQNLSFFIRFVSPISLKILNVFLATFINLKTRCSKWSLLFRSEIRCAALQGRKYRARNTGPEIQGRKYWVGNTGPEIQGRKYRAGNSGPKIQDRKYRTGNKGLEIQDRKFRAGNTGLASRNIYSAQAKST